MARKSHCSICGEKGHIKTTCPVIKNQKEEREKFITETAILALPDLLANPLVVAFLWYTFSSTYKPANSANKVIVGAEVIPALDLGLPPGVVLGAIMQETDDFINSWNKAKDFIFNFPMPDISLPEIIPEEEKEAFVTALVKTANKFFISLVGVTGVEFKA